MLPEFSFDGTSGEASSPTPEEQAVEAELFKRRLPPAERDRLERLLLERLKERKAGLQELLEQLTGNWSYEDGFYRFYHQSWKVYALQQMTGRAVQALQELLPERKLNLTFEEIIRGGTGKEFKMENNRQWPKHTRPILEAFCHAKFMLQMAVRYADLPDLPKPLPSGYAALLYLFDLR
jgi:hypothetical protein